MSANEFNAKPDNGPEVAEPELSPLKNRNVRIVLIVILAVALISAIAWFVHYQTVGRFMQTTDDAYIQADAVTVSPKVGGYVNRVFVTDNQAVIAGQPLLQIDPRDYRSQTDQISAQIDIARANAQGVRLQIAEQRAAVDHARGDLVAAQGDAAFAHSEADRYAPLAANGAETGVQLAQLRNQARQADARVASARAALAGAAGRIATLGAQIGQALAQGEAAQAQLAGARVNAEATLIRATISGRVGNKTVQPGQFAQPGVRMMSIVPVDRTYIMANFKETQLGLMRAGQPVTIEVDALSGVEIHGRVESFAPGTGAQFSLLPPQNATGNFTRIVQRVPIRIAIDAGAETRKFLLPGMSVTVTVDTRTARGAIDRIRQEQEARSR